MDGATVYEFTLFEVFDQIVQLIEDCSIIENQNDIDYFVLHQANGYVIDSLARKLQIDPSRNLRSIKEFGNTSSASIPLSIVNNLINIESGKILLMSGFGVGLSWASMIYKNDFEVRVMKII
jgi:3-oxoacyl-[acyl-carrier-protein] synthase-3